MQKLQHKCTIQEEERRWIMSMKRMAIELHNNELIEEVNNNLYNINECAGRCTINSLDSTIQGMIYVSI